jgi:hypothetical protein
VLIPVVVSPIRIEVALVTVPVEVRSLEFALKPFRHTVSMPPYTVATIYCI